jgi:hypothetical protein
MSPESEQLKAARASGDLSKVVGVLKAEGIMEMANAGTTTREQLDVVDGAARLASHLAGQGTKGVDRRQAVNGVQPGTTVTARGAAKTQSSRAEKLGKAIAAFKDWTQDQRDEYIASDKFEALSDRQQELISEAFTQLEDRAYETSIGIENIDFDAETPTVDSIIGEEDDTEDEVVDDSDFDAMFEQAEWEAPA